MFLYAPAMLAIATLADLFVEILYGKQWLPAVPLLRVLALAALLYPLHMINLHALMAQGHARLMFRIELLKKVIGVMLLLVGAEYGIEGIAWSQVVHSVLVLTLNSHYSRKWLGYGALAQLRDAAAPILAAAASAILVLPVATTLDWPVAAKLPVLLLLGGGAYLALMSAAKTQAWSEFTSILAQWRTGGAA